MKVLAVVVHIQFIAAQFYEPSSGRAGGTIWQFFNPRMELGPLVAIFNSWQGKRNFDRFGGEGLPREYLEANVPFQLGIAFMAGLLSNRIGSEVPDPENTMGLLWTAIEATQPLLMLTAGSHRMRSGEWAACAVDGAAGAPRKLLTRLPYAQSRSRS